jgi:hypothetical protein
MPDLELALGAVMKELAPLAREIPESDPAGNDTPDHERTMDLIRRLKPLLESGNTSSLTLLGEIKTTFPALNGKTADLIKQIEGFDFTRALEILPDIQGGILGGAF